MADHHPSSRQQPDTFATTRWSMVVAAGHHSSTGSREALESLCAAYWHPLYAYIRRRVPDVSEAHDLTQAFFAELLEKNYVRTATPARGRFRAFLLTSFKHYLSKQWAKARAQKRGGGRNPLSFDFQSADTTLQIEPVTTLTAEQLYDQQWAIALLGRTMERLQQEFDQNGRARQYEVLKNLLIGEQERVTFAEAAAELNVSPAAARQAASRMRRRYRELLRDEIAQTLSDREEVEEEIRNLFTALQL